MDGPPMRGASVATTCKIRISCVISCFPWRDVRPLCSHLPLGDGLKLDGFTGWLFPCRGGIPRSLEGGEITRRHTLARIIPQRKLPAQRSEVPPAGREFALRN